MSEKAAEKAGEKEEIVEEKIEEGAKTPKVDNKQEKKAVAADQQEKKAEAADKQEKKPAAADKQDKNAEAGAKADKPPEPKGCDWCGEAWDEVISGQFRPAPDVKTLLQFFYTVEGLAGRGMSIISRAYPEINNPATMKRIQKLKVHFPTPEEVAMQSALDPKKMKPAALMSAKTKKPLPYQQRAHAGDNKPMRDYKPDVWKSPSPRFGGEGGGGRARSNSRFSPMRRDSSVGMRNDMPRWQHQNQQQQQQQQSRDDFGSRSDRPVWNTGRLGSSSAASSSMGSRMDFGTDYGFSSSSQLNKSGYSPFGNSASMQQGYQRDSYQGNADMMERNLGLSSGMPQQHSSQWSSMSTPLMSSKTISLDRSLPSSGYAASPANASDDPMPYGRLMSTMKDGTGGQSLHDQDFMQRMLQQLIGMQGNMSSSQADGSRWKIDDQSGMM